MIEKEWSEKRDRRDIKDVNRQIDRNKRQEDKAWDRKRERDKEWSIMKKRDEERKIE